MSEDRNTDDPKKAWKTFTEELEVAGHQLVNEVNRLLSEGNVRKLQVRSEKGDVFLTIPLTAGAVAGGVVALTAPWIAVLAAVAGLVTKVKLEVVREEKQPPKPTETPEAKDGSDVGYGD